MDAAAHSVDHMSVTADLLHSLVASRPVVLSDGNVQLPVAINDHDGPFRVRYPVDGTASRADDVKLGFVSLSRTALQESLDAAMPSLRHASSSSAAAPATRGDSKDAATTDDPFVALGQATAALYACIARAPYCECSVPVVLGADTPTSLWEGGRFEKPRCLDARLLECVHVAGVESAAAAVAAAKAAGRPRPVANAVAAPSEAVSSVAAPETPAAAAAAAPVAPPAPPSSHAFDAPKLFCQRVALWQTQATIVDKVPVSRTQLSVPSLLFLPCAAIMPEVFEKDDRRRSGGEDERGNDYLPTRLMSAALALSIAHRVVGYALPTQTMPVSMTEVRSEAPQYLIEGRPHILCFADTVAAVCVDAPSGSMPLCRRREAVVVCGAHVEARALLACAHPCVAALTLGADVDGVPVREAIAGLLSDCREALRVEETLLNGDAGATFDGIPLVPQGALVVGCDRASATAIGQACVRALAACMASARVRSRSEESITRTISIHAAVASRLRGLRERIRALDNFAAEAVECTSRDSSFLGGMVSAVVRVNAQTRDAAFYVALAAHCFFLHHRSALKAAVDMVCTLSTQCDVICAVMRTCLAACDLTMSRICAVASAIRFPDGRDPSKRVDLGACPVRVLADTVVGYTPAALTAFFDPAEVVYGVLAMSYDGPGRSSKPVSATSALDAFLSAWRAFLLSRSEVMRRGPNYTERATLTASQFRYTTLTTGLSGTRRYYSVTLVTLPPVGIAGTSVLHAAPNSDALSRFDVRHVLLSPRQVFDRNRAAFRALCQKRTDLPMSHHIWLHRDCAAPASTAAADAAAPRGTGSAAEQPDEERPADRVPPKKKRRVGV